MAAHLIYTEKRREYQGLSTDTKPTTGVPDGSTYYELDTENLKVYDTVNINPATSNGWW